MANPSEYPPVRVEQPPAGYPGYSAAQGYPPAQGIPPAQGYPPQQAYPPPAYGSAGYQQPGYAQPQMIVAQPGIAIILTNSPNLSEIPVTMTCPHCQKSMTTNITKRVGAGTWLVCVCLCAFGFFPFNYVPFCLDPCKDTYHFCSSCNQMVGIRPLLG